MTAISSQLAELAHQRAASTAQLQALSEHFKIAAALADIALIEWLNEHANELRGSDHLAWVTGWTSDVSGAALRRALDASGARYILRLSDAPAGMNAPLVLHNPGWARAFEVFARMLGTPGRYESDPSQLLAVIASSIFGFMFGDVGQGAVICLAGIVLGRRVPLTRMLVPGGIMAILFGVLFGSVFCREDIIPALWIRPMDDPVTILLAAVIVGIAIITLGLLLDAIQMHWRGEARRWWAQRAGLFTAYAGLLISLLRTEGLLVAGVGAAWFIVGAAVLTPKGRLSAMIEAAAEFVEQSLRLLVNTVSFARIGAFALAHAGLSVAIIEMAQASGRVGYWIVLAVGNVLVIVLEGVVVSIQTTRLLLFEFFIRFLTGSGREFKPLPPPVIGKQHRSRSNFEGHVMKANLKIPALMLALAAAVAIGVTLMLLQMMPAAAQTATRAAADSAVAPWAMMAAAIAAGLSTLAAGYAVAVVGSAAVGALAEKPELLGRVLILVGLAEGIAIYGLIVAVLILNRAG